MTAGGDAAQLEQLLEDDEWGWLRESRRSLGIGRLEMPTAVSLNEYKHAEGLLHTE